MLEIKKVLLGANTCTPELNDFARLVAEELPGNEIDCRDLANAVMSVAFEVKRDQSDYHAKYPDLCSFIKQGGDMCALSAKITQVIDAGASAKYAESYRAVSAIFFGK